MNDIVIARPDTTTLEQEAFSIIERARELQITNQDEHTIALVTIKSLRNQEKAIAAHFEPVRKAADAAKKEVLLARDTLVKPLVEARGILNNKAVTYAQEQEQIRLELQRKADEEARIAQEKADAEAKAAEDKRLAALEEAIEEEDEEKAEEILEADPEPVEEIVPEKVESQVAEVQGASTRTTWSAEVIDELALAIYAASSRDRVSVIQPNMKELNKMAVAHKDKLDIPGVKAVPKTTVVTR